MAYEQKDMSGSLFKNDRKESDTHADYKGTALINGVEHWLDAWINTSNNGTKYMSLKFKPKDATQRGQNSTFHSPSPADLDDDVPW